MKQVLKFTLAEEFLEGLLAEDLNNNSEELNYK